MPLPVAMPLEAGNDACRACLRSAGDSAVSLTNPVIKLYGQLINTHVSLEDGLPQQLCSKCSKLIVKFSSFREMCISSEATLKELYTSNKDIQSERIDYKDVKWEIEEPPDVLHKTEFNSETDDQKVEIKFEAPIDTGDDYTCDDDNQDTEFEVDSSLLIGEIKKCGRMTLRQRKTSINIKNENNGNFHCGLCKNVYDAWESVAAHLESHKDDTACGLCNQAFTDWPQLVTHRSVHIQGTKRMYYCYICSKKHVSGPYLEAHLSMIHFGGKGIYCKICNKTYKTGRKLQKHMRAHNVQESKLIYQCEICSKKFQTKKLLETHLVAHSDVKSCVCDVCGAMYKHVAALKIHIDTKHTNKPPIACGLCDATPTTIRELRTHLEGHKSDTSCGICKMASMDWPQLLVHRYRHIPHGKCYECHLCAKRPRSLEALEVHVRTAHGAGMECKICSKTFFNARKFRKHIYIHTNINRFKCEHCDRRCTTRRNLLIHSAIHSIEKNYACDKCDFRCKISSGLNEHKKRMHMLGQFPCCQCDKVFKNLPSLRDHERNHMYQGALICPHCGKKFTLNDKLRKHIRTHSRVRRYKCDMCPKEFLNKPNLISHINRHNGIRAYKCEFCTARFYSNSVLIKHRRVHTGEKPYVCKICHRGFTGGHNLKVHMKVHGLTLVVKRNTQDLTMF